MKKSKIKIKISFVFNVFDDNHNNNNNNNDNSGSKLQNSNTHTHTQTDRIQRLEKMVQLLLDYRYFLFPSVLHACMWVCMWQISFVWVDFILTSFVLSFQTFEMGLFMIVVAVVVDLRFPLGQLKEKKDEIEFRFSSFLYRSVFIYFVFTCCRWCHVSTFCILEALFFVHQWPEFEKRESVKITIKYW